MTHYLNRQGPTSGPSIAAPSSTSTTSKRVAEAYVKQINDAHVLRNPIVTQVVPLDKFYTARATTRTTPPRIDPTYIVASQIQGREAQEAVPRLRPEAEIDWFRRLYTGTCREGGKSMSRITRGTTFAGQWPAGRDWRSNSARVRDPAQTEHDRFQAVGAVRQSSEQRCHNREADRVTHVITGWASAVCAGRSTSSRRARQKKRGPRGMSIAAWRSPRAFENLKAGTHSDEEIENSKRAIEALARSRRHDLLQLHAGRGWTRTNTKLPERGGALTSEFDAAAPNAETDPLREISEEKMWANITRFLKEVIPVPTSSRSNGAAPDDPPLSRSPASRASAPAPGTTAGSWTLFPAP